MSLDGFRAISASLLMQENDMIRKYECYTFVSGNPSGKCSSSTRRLLLNFFRRRITFSLFSSFWYSVSFAGKTFHDRRVFCSLNAYTFNSTVKMKQLFTRIAFVAACLLFFRQDVQAQENSPHYQAAIELAEQLQESSYKSIIASVIGLYAKQVPDNQRELFKTSMTEFLEKFLSWDVMKDLYAKIYMAQFTESELKDLSAFYKTPTGIKLMQRTPDIVQQSAAAGQKIVMEHQPELMEIMKKNMNKNRTNP
jgi:hypothetical protein